MYSAELSIHLINSAILTVLVSLFVLWRYRVAVLAGMMRSVGAFVAPPAPSPRADHPSGATLAALLRRERGRRRAIASATC
jgi:hypothetical protein